ncbi:unnamed protein product [Ceratitis capitata]|uniref:(Mediterranean fruit fly) hypothetical protein n=1 Tax=Ceratitis capitata TaxID=7213 RepID=A0A811VAY9_CERCA|nr:unnamed protein product [Ceratitis capitata]
MELLLLGATPATIPSVYRNFFSILDNANCRFWRSSENFHARTRTRTLIFVLHMYVHTYICTYIGTCKVDTTMNFSNFSTFATAAASSSDFHQLLQIFSNNISS